MAVSPFRHIPLQWSQQHFHSLVKQVFNFLFTGHRFPWDPVPVKLEFWSPPWLRCHGWAQFNIPGALF